MKYLKRAFISLLFVLISIFTLTLIFTTLNYFDVIGNKIMNISKIIIPLFSVAIGGFIIGRNSLKNGWLEGLKLGLIIILLISIISLILKQNINLKDLVFDFLLIISSIIGSMFGINIKKENN